MGAVVVDAGAHVGGWSAAVLCTGRDVRLHLFEPAPAIFSALEANPLLALRGGIAFNRAALGDTDGERAFQFYRDCAEMSGFHRRNGSGFDTIAEPEALSVAVERLDGYCRRRGIRHVHFLKLDVEGAELDVLKGSSGLLRHARIDCVQFEYGGTYADAGTSLEETHALMSGYGFTLYRMLPGRLEKIASWKPELENYRYANFLALHRRVLPFFGAERPIPLDLADLCRTLGIRPRGILHLGANEAGELPVYRRMGVERVLYVEANPAAAARLAERLKAEPGVTVAACAAGDHDGRIAFRLASNHQCSSILPLARHRDIYPAVVETGMVEVPCRRIDTLLAELNLDQAGFNLMCLDIQGAELLALAGAPGTLGHMDGILVEVNFEELYQGCAQIDEVDDFLEPLGFRRVALACPFHPSWGDAFYARVARTAGPSG